MILSVIESVFVHLVFFLFNLELVALFIAPFVDIDINYSPLKSSLSSSSSSLTPSLRYCCFKCSHTPYYRFQNMAYRQSRREAFKKILLRAPTTARCAEMEWVLLNFIPLFNWKKYLIPCLFFSLYQDGRKMKKFVN